MPDGCCRFWFGWAGRPRVPRHPHAGLSRRPRAAVESAPRPQHGTRPVALAEAPRLWGGGTAGPMGLGSVGRRDRKYGPLTADVALDRRAVDVALDLAHTFLNSSMSRSMRCTRRISSSRRSMV